MTPQIAKNGQFDKSICFYAKMTAQLEKELEALCKKGGLVSNFEESKQLLELQARVD